MRDDTALIQEWTSIPTNIRTDSVNCADAAIPYAVQRRGDGAPVLSTNSKG